MGLSFPLKQACLQFLTLPSSVAPPGVTTAMEKWTPDASSLPTVPRILPGLRTAQTPSSTFLKEGKEETWGDGDLEESCALTPPLLCCIVGAQ